MSLCGHFSSLLLGKYLGLERLGEDQCTPDPVGAVGLRTGHQASTPTSPV